MSRILVDVDDLYCEQQITDWLQPLRKALGEPFRITCYAPPNRLGPVHDLRDKYSWITFGIHGFEHTFCECRAWTVDYAKAHIEKALEMGYHPLFKAPNWTYDIELEMACTQLNVVLHHHEDFEPSHGVLAYPGRKAVRLPLAVAHTHILRNPNTDFIAEAPSFKLEHLLTFSEFVTPFEVARL